MSRISLLLAFAPLTLAFQVQPSHGSASLSLRMSEKETMPNSSSSALDALRVANELPLSHLTYSELNSTLARLLFERLGQHKATEPLCDQCSTSWMFVVSTGRSGSTTVLEMLNALPMVYMAGENGGILSDLRKLYDTKIKDLMDKDDVASGTAWQHEPISPERVFCAVQALTKAIMGEFTIQSLSHPIIGFKEIRYDTERDLDFMMQVFPCARFVVNTRRDTQEQSQSAFNSDKDHFDHLKSVATAWKSKHLNQTFEVDLEDFSPTRFNEMLQWMGVSGCSFTSVAHANSDGGYGADEGGVSVDGKCEFHGFM